MYFHESCEDKLLEFKGEHYKFEIGKPVEHHGGAGSMSFDLEVL